MVIVATSIECAFSLARVSSASLINFRAGGLRCREGAYGVEPRKWSSEKIAFGKIMILAMLQSAAEAL